MLTLKLGKLGGSRPLQLILLLNASFTLEEIQTFQLPVLQGVLVTLKEIDEGRSLNTPNAKPQTYERYDPLPLVPFSFSSSCTHLRCF
jgi:hypothetical protein